MTRIVLLLSIVTVIALGGCAPKYYCETQFAGEGGVIEKEGGKKYWPSHCSPQGFPYNVLY